LDLSSIDIAFIINNKITMNGPREFAMVGNCCCGNIEDEMVKWCMDECLQVSTHQLHWKYL